jgi:geranylgeranyl transferase type-2 subunit beta
MSASAYLDMLDAMLRPGMAGLSSRFVESQTRFVATCQQPDGGFRGRQGESDLYYTDFALRVLAWLAPEHAAFAKVAGTPTNASQGATGVSPVPNVGQVANLPNTRQIGNLPHNLPHDLPHDTVECFNLLHIGRLLEHHAKLAGTGHPLAGRVPATLHLIDWLYQHLLPCGGFARLADDSRVSAYHTFLGGLCFQMLGIEMPAVEDAARAIEALRRADGGYAELAGQDGSQTNATAAAIGFLAMHDALPPEQAASAARFLAAVQADDGGLKPHAAVERGDLLSTFTGLLTLAALGGLQNVDTARVAQFLRSAAHPGGGFRASATDDTPDVEYTYYGVGTLALLRVQAASSR